jgi:hypothetical protein
VQANVSQTIDVVSEGSQGERDLAVVKYEAHNGENVGVFVIISGLYVCTQPTGTMILGGTNLGPSESCDNPIVQPIPRLTWMPADSTISFRLAIESPKSTPVVRVVARIAYARGDRLQPVEPGQYQRIEQIDKCQRVLAVELREASRYERLAQRSKTLVYYSLADGRSNYYLANEESPGKCPGNTESILSRYYGVTEGRTEWAGRPASVTTGQTTTPAPQPPAPATATATATAR